MITVTLWAFCSATFGVWKIYKNMEGYTILTDPIDNPMAEEEFVGCN